MVQVYAPSNQLTMKKILGRFSLISLVIFPTSSVFVCPAENHNENNATCKIDTSTNQKNATPKTNDGAMTTFMHADDRTLKSLSHMADLDVQMKDLIYQSR